MVAVKSLRPAADRDYRAVRADRHRIDPTDIFRSDRNPDRALELAVSDRPDPHGAIVTASHRETAFGVDGLRSNHCRMHSGIDGENRAVVQVRRRVLGP